MNKIFLSDYILGKRIHSSNEFFANIPSILYLFKSFDFENNNGDFSFVDHKKEDLTPIFNMAKDPAIGNLFIFMKSWLSNPENYVIKNSHSEIDCSEFLGYVRHDVLEFEGSFFKDSFAQVSKKENVINIISFTKDFEAIYFRGYYNLINLSSHAAKVLKVISSLNPILKKDKIKKKYQNKFTDSEYLAYNHND